MSRAVDALVGRTLGEFVLREKIGEGGFGAVYRAVQPALDREAVIKVLHARLHASKVVSERFLREAKLASKLDHPYAAHIYAFGAEADGQLWIAMELVRGTPLDQVLRLQGPVSLERMVQLLDRICEVVHTAHEAGIVHRDLKPANVMVLARAGRLLPKLLDFGIAKGLATSSSPGTDDTYDGSSGLDEASDPLAATLGTPPTGISAAQLGLTVRGAVMGSPPYMAPEQWLDAGTVDARTDLYALAILTYECLTGKPPFVASSITAFAAAHANDRAPPLGASFPSALDKVFAKALAKDARDRYPDALALSAAFRAASGIAVEVQPLPAIDPMLRELATAGVPQPIAEAIAAYEASRNAHQGRDALAIVGRTIARYLGLLALACRSRVASADHASETIRTLYRRSLTDGEWVDLARELTRPWTGNRDAYPIPELVGVFHDGPLLRHLDALVDLRSSEAGTDDVLLALLEASVAHLGELLEAIAFLRDYPLVVTTAGGHAERWMGLRRAQRGTIAVRGKGLANGVAALLDRDGSPVLSLEPLFQIAAPSPGAPLELFMFEGRDRRGAKLVALPTGFEHHDDALWEWFRAQLTGSLDETESTVAEEKPPYRGLAAFSADDNALFVGREKLVDAFANRLKVSALLVVVGRSGAGKSSFVHAGVVPSLPPTWRTVALRPGPSPLGALAARLEHVGIAVEREELLADREALGRALRADASKRGPLLVVVDQLEEMFTLCSDELERRAFADALASAARSADDPVRVVFTLRDDFLVRAEQLAALRNRLGQGLQILTVPAAEDLLRIVTEPARRVGYELEGTLAQDMVDEVADQPGALALISFTASKLWELRDRHFKQLTRSAYKTLGGVGGALGRHAEQTLDGMPPEERALTREAFRHLVTTENTRAVLPRKELRQLLGNDAHADGVIEKLVAARLLVASENDTGAETVEIIHEALLINWPRLVEWQREDSEGTRFREQLRSAAKQWEARGRAKGLLWRGDALGELTRWRGRHSGPLTDVEAAFTDASLADVARSRRVTRILIAAAFGVLSIVVVGLVVFNTRISGQRAELRESLQRRYEDQGRQLVLANDPLHALAYLDKARELGANGRAHDFLVAQAVQATDGEILEVRNERSLSYVRFSHDGRRLLTGGHGRQSQIWDAATGHAELSIEGVETGVVGAFSPDDHAVLAIRDRVVGLWDARTGREIAHLVHDAEVSFAIYAPDGATVATGTTTGVITVWSVHDGAKRFSAPESDSPITAMAFSPDGRFIAAGDARGGARVRDAATGASLHELVGHRDRIKELTFAADGLKLATSSLDRTAIVWSATDGSKLMTLSHQGAVPSLAFAPDGANLVTGSSDHNAVIWDLATGAQRRRLEGHTAGITRVRYSPDGLYIATTSEDATTWLWDAATGRVAARWRGDEERVNDADFDGAGKRLITGGEDGRAIVWNVAPQEHIVWLRGHTDAILDARFSSDGGQIATASADGTARVWNAATGNEVLAIHAPGGGLSNSVFGPSAQRLATFGADGAVRLWDLPSGRASLVIAASTPGQDAVIEWSGTSLVLASVDGWLRCWDTNTGALRFETRAHGGALVYSATFDPSGTSIVTTGDDNATRVWTLDGKLLHTYAEPDHAISASYDATGTRVLSAVSRERAKIWRASDGTNEVELVGHVGRIVDATWSKDSGMAITASTDDTARIWDASTGAMLATLARSQAVIVARFSPDGRRVVTVGDGDIASVQELPLVPPEGATLTELLACRVPFAVRDDRLVGRSKVACVGDRRPR